MATVLFKVFTLTVKTMSKPLAAQFERYIMGHPVARSKVISLAQGLHRMDVSITRGAEGKTGRIFVGDMSEEKAVALASKVVSEGFLYSTAVVLLLLEMDRKNKEDAAKKEKAAAEERRVNDQHERHIQTEKELRKQQNDLEEIMGRMEERLLMIEEQVLDIRQSQSKQRRWGFF